MRPLKEVPVKLRTLQLVSTQPTQQQLLDYANALILVNSYAYAITNQKLPMLEHPTTNYGRFAEKFVPAKGHALDWSANIFVSLLAVPNVIKDHGATLFELEKSMIRPYLRALIADPGNSVARRGLGDSLGELRQMIDGQVRSIEGLELRLRTFCDDLATDAKTLAVIAAEALDDVREDREAIVQLNTMIGNLRKQVDNARTLLTLSQAGTAVSLFVGLIGAVVCYAIPGATLVGGAVIAVAVVGEGASIAGWVIEQKRIALLQKEIENQQGQIQARNRDIVLLQAISGQFEALTRANEAAKQALEAVKAMWLNLARTVGDVQSDLTETASHAEQALYQQALADFERAETHWAGVVAFAKALAGIDYNWQSSDGTWHPYRERAPSADAGYLTEVPRAA